ncbi:TPA: helix-turn-helix transcriptional regulator [Streptococcus suis]|nr:helix-turn-helix transcriptional regulator [Streptococcus suis]HEM4810710.1 helix-turn-helix transcriptional regulator [Streptococcus suis]HEM4838770.1 helix-turn-helix transcriptional regulator [Streptococcus suis]HEM4915794.1 helix-turn-helix transcriptional regulator [Streptococcus suis]
MNRLKILRKEKGETQDQVAEVAGVSKRSYIYWENGESTIKSDKAQALADHFGVPVGYLLGYDVKLSDAKKALLESTQSLEDKTKQAFEVANSVFVKQVTAIEEITDILIEGISADKLNKQIVLEALNQIKEFATELDEVVSKMTEFQAKYTAEQIFKYRLQKSMENSTILNSEI